MTMTQTDLNDPLLLKFASDRPDEVAALLSSSALGEVSGFLEALPEATAASIAARLPSWQLTGLLAIQEPTRLCQMLVAAPTDEAIALISHLNSSRYESLIAACPAKQLRALHQLLDFPSHSLAALVTTRFIRALADVPCGTFADQLANNPKPQPGPVLVVDSQGKYLGMVGLQAAFARKNRGRPIREVATAVEPLNGLTLVETALTSRQWARHTELPVVDLRQRLLGVVSHSSLQRVAGDSTTIDFTLERMLSELAKGYLNICGRILESALGRSK